MQSESGVIYKETEQKKKRRSRVVQMPKKSPKVSPEITRDLQKEEVKDVVRNEEKLEELVDRSHVVLYKCSTFFPFDLFPDEISIEPAQVNVKKQEFFWTSQIISIPIRNISDVIMQTIPFFASLTITDQYFKQNTVTVSFIRKNKALRARKIIQGLIIACKEGVDVSKIDTEALIKQTEDLGEMQAIKED